MANWQASSAELLPVSQPRNANLGRRNLGIAPQAPAAAAPTTNIDVPSIKCEMADMEICVVMGM